MTGKLVVAIAAIVWLIWTAAGVMVAGLSVMVFDADGSQNRLLPWLMFGSAACWPLWSLGCMAFAAYKLVRGQTRPAVQTIVASLVGAVPMVLVLAIGLALGK